jgi:hypothetical protein
MQFIFVFIYEITLNSRATTKTQKGGKKGDKSKSFDLVPTTITLSPHKKTITSINNENIINGLVATFPYDIPDSYWDNVKETILGRFLSKKLEPIPNIQEVDETLINKKERILKMFKPRKDLQKGGLTQMRNKYILNKQSYLTLKFK